MVRITDFLRKLVKSVTNPKYLNSSVCVCMHILSLQQTFLHLLRWGKGTQTGGHQQPSPLSISDVFIPPHLIGYLRQDLISDWWSGKASLNDVISKQVFLSSIQVWISHETQNLSNTELKIQQQSCREVLKMRLGLGFVMLPV